MARQFRPDVEDALQRAAQRYGVPPETLRAFTSIESGGNPSARTGGYHGLLQLSPQEFARYGGRGNIYDTNENMEVGAAKLKAEGDTFEKKYGRQPTASELYMIHQQGEGGSAAHWANPDQPAWKSMLSTGEGQQKGEGWARQAIWGNVPDDVKRQYGSVDNITSKQFTDLWDRKVQAMGGQAPQPASSGPETVPEAGLAPLGLMQPPPAPVVASAIPTGAPASAAPPRPDAPDETQNDTGGLAARMADIKIDPPRQTTDATDQREAAPMQLVPPGGPRRLDLAKLQAALANRSPLGIYRG